MEYLRERLRSRKVHPRCLERTAHRGALRPQTAYWSPMEEIEGNTFQREIKYNPSTRDEKPSPDNAVDDTHVLSLPDFAILIPVMIGEIVTRSIDGASLVDTDDTNSMGARHRDDTEGV